MVIIRLEKIFIVENSDGMHPPLRGLTSESNTTGKKLNLKPSVECSGIENI